MKFDDLDQYMRLYETARDYCVPPGNHMVARLDGRSFTKLTKEKHAFERPFDEKFRDMMVSTTAHLMTCGFSIAYGYTQSDEISLLLDLEDQTFGRKTRKIISVLAGEASARFSIELGEVATLDCRLSILPGEKQVIDYFRWRQEDAHRNSLNAHCYWMLRSQGLSKQEATARIEKQNTAFKNELLFQNGINFNELPSWQKRGLGLHWELTEKEGYNPITQEKVITERRGIHIMDELPIGEAYAQYIQSHIEKPA